MKVANRKPLSKKTIDYRRVVLKKSIVRSISEGLMELKLSINNKTTDKQIMCGKIYKWC